MTYYAGPMTISSTGTGKQFDVGFQPTYAKLTVCGKSTDNVSHMSVGVVDESGYQYCQSTYQDTTGGKSTNTDTKVVRHYERVSSNITEVLSASFNSFYASGIKLDVTIANTNYPVLLECWN